ncbi:UBN2_3 domain-containing protein [Cucumis melo var. makuwa]|uniref:UBN2_3 domain-containing protein n=1 Tax=Cucumis melo var. makuwa TaxID=1194695 RepID=A0A5D3B8L9_CUCMM|nr:UBN2_3 domain-containing protein [Cucumis melo var. makuwa]TYJ95633.1 UBN2_3 domain-containing protein [Cucumis melo var. makuwa]
MWPRGPVQLMLSLRSISKIQKRQEKNITLTSRQRATEESKVNLIHRSVAFITIDSIELCIFVGVNCIDIPTNESDLPMQLHRGEKLNGSNYFSWSQSVKMILEERHRFGLPTGEIPCPPLRDSQERFWIGEDSLIWAMLINNMEPQIGKPLLYATTGGKKCPPNDKQNSRRAYVSESVGTSQPSSHTGKRNNLSPSTLGVVAQSSMLQLLSLISVDGKNRWIFFSGATYHLTGLELGEDDWHYPTM